MSADRCPQCSGVIRAGADWCGLCYADLRPPPPPAPPPARPTPPAVPARSTVEDSLAAELSALAGSVDVLDPLSAPLAEVTGEAAAVPAPRAAEPLADPSTPATGWPCLECGSRNDFELSTCTGCGMAFGAPLRVGAPALPGTRQSRLFAAVGAVVVVMAVIALLSLLTGSGPTPLQPVGDTLVPIDQPAGQPVPPPNG